MNCQTQAIYIERVILTFLSVQAADPTAKLSVFGIVNAYTKSYTQNMFLIDSRNINNSLSLALEDFDL